MRRKFLIATADKSLQLEMQSWIENYIPNAHCIFATDGAEAMSKIQTDPLHVVITSVDLATTDGYKLTRWVLRNKSAEKIAVILLVPAPTEERFVDEVVTSQVQFVDLTKGEAEVQRVLTNAVNFVFPSPTQKDFFALSIPSGHQLIKQGEKADNVYLVKSGELVATTLRGQERFELGKISAGEFVGEMAYLNGEARTADVFASTHCELIGIPANILDQVLFTKPAWAKALMKTLTKRLIEANKKAS